MTAIIQSSSPEDTKARIWKRRYEALEEQLALGTAPKSKDVKHTQTYAGRSLRRVVTLFDHIQDLVEENDRRTLMEIEAAEDLDGSSDDEARSGHTREQDHLFTAYQELVKYIPSVIEMVERGSSIDVAMYYKNVLEGAGMACGDDTGSMKTAVVEWVDRTFGVSVPPLLPKYKHGRGLENDNCGRLLCPAEWDWMDETVRANIREGHPDFRVTAHSWPIFLYADYKVNPEDIGRGLLRSKMLVKAYKHIFTSPTSAATEEENADDTTAGRAPKRTKRDCLSRKAPVAALINLRSVTPRSIAYIAVQLRVALLSLGCWNENDIDFSYRDFYNAIVDYFEVVPGPLAERNNRELLNWWNKQIFGMNHSVTPAQVHATSSVVLWNAQRAAREVDL